MFLEEKIAAFLTGLAPEATHMPYMDLSRIRFDTHRGPSSSAACQLAAGVIGAEAVKILLRRGKIYPAPFYHQFDPYRSLFIHKKLEKGNRSPQQFLKRKRLVKFFRKMREGAKSR